jgi:hypothetical protein
MTDNQPDRDGAEMGTRRHAEILTDGRHPGVRDALQWLTYSHLPPALRAFSEPFYAAAVDLVLVVGTDSPELSSALNHLIAAKDSAVRAGIKHQQGRAGSVPRPQEVVDPPHLTSDAHGSSNTSSAATRRALGQAD